jgi:hypothetical protein
VVGGGLVAVLAGCASMAQALMREQNPVLDEITAYTPMKCQRKDGATTRGCLTGRTFNLVMSFGFTAKAWG